MMAAVRWLAIPLLLLGCHKSDLARARAHPRFDAHLHLAVSELPRAAELMAREGVVGGVNLSGGWAGRGLEQALEQASRLPQVRLLTFANLNYEGVGQPGWAEREIRQLELAKALGARGLKIFKALGLTVRDASGQLVRVDDPRLAPVFEAAGRLGLPVAIHTGDPKAFFVPDSPQNERHAELALHPNWSFARPGEPSWEEVFGQYVNLVRAHPATTFIGVHFGNDPEEPFRVGELLDRNPNLYVDVAARLGELGRQDPAKLRALFVRHKTRILFGTDWAVMPDGMTLGAGNGHPETVADLDRFFALHADFFETGRRGLANPVPIQGAWTIDAIELPEEVRDALYTGNAERLFAIELPPELPAP